MNKFTIYLLSDYSAFIEIEKIVLYPLYKCLKIILKEAMTVPFTCGLNFSGLHVAIEKR